MAIIRNEGSKAGKKIQRTAAYARVSSLSDTQDGSYETQVDYFTRYIQENPDMEFVGVYGDHGKSGREMKKRDGMQKLLEDAKAGAFEQVLCKSVSRWARNLTELVGTVRELKALGIAVIFEKEGINTLDPKNDLILGIFSTIAAEESNTISNNIRWAREKHLEKGEPWDKARYGYRMEMPGHRWVIIPSEGERVKRAFYLAGKCSNYTEICEELNRMEQRDGTGKVWKNSTITNLLRAETYTGDYLSNKEITILTPEGKKRVRNRGQQDQTLIEEHHEPLVSHELFNVVQTLMQNKLLHTNIVNFRKGADRLVQMASVIADEEAGRLETLHKAWEADNALSAADQH